MKRTLLIALALLAGATGAKAQSNTVATPEQLIGIERFYELTGPVSEAHWESYENKDYAAAEQKSYELLGLIESLDEKDKKLYGPSLFSDAYYNLACNLSLQGKKREAIDAFAKCVENNYRSYSHALQDSDLDILRRDKRFKALMAELHKRTYPMILKAAAPYQVADTVGMPRLTYQKADATMLKNVREYFQLDTISRGANEVEHIKNILAFAHNNIRHNGGNYALCEKDAIDIYNYNKVTGKGVNCRQLAIALNEMYLAMGYASRYVTCLPQDPNDPDCHVINCVWSTELGKWLWMDPTFYAWVADEEGNLLSIAEVREYIRSDKPVVLNPDANWNNESPQTADYYLYNYMAKNLYWINVVVDSRFNPESRYRDIGSRFVSLVPVGFEPFGSLSEGEFITSDPSYFWQSPHLGR
jgi:tetratricopeptide (TPR) repeat protein